MKKKVRFNEKTEYAKLKEIVSSIPEDRKTIAEGLIDDAAFMLEQLGNLKDYIRENGVSEDYKNGENQYGKKQSSEFSAYIQLQKSYLATVRQLNDMIPKNTETAPAGEALMEYISK